MLIADNIKRVREQIAEAAVLSGRTSADITLVAAAKTATADMVRDAIAAGADAVGENRVQEMLAKLEQDAYRGAPLHFIGHLQSNKVRQVVGKCELIESVGSLSLLELIGKYSVSLGIVQDVLVEVNIGREPSKSGVYPENLPELLDSAAEIKGIKVLGLMAIPPAFDENGKYFDTMSKLYVDMRGKKYDNVSMRVLSMGMSDSFAQAVRAGANMVRIGSAIFGARSV